MLILVHEQPVVVYVPDLTAALVWALEFREEAAQAIASRLASGW